MSRSPLNFRCDDENELARVLFEGFKDALLIFEPISQLVVDANSSASALIGRPVSDLLNCHIAELFVPSDELRELSWDSQSQTAFELENVGIKQGDSVSTNVDLLVRRITYDNEELGLVILRSRCQSHHGNANDDDTRENWQLRQLIDGVNAIVWEADATTWRFTFVNEEAEAMLGYPVSQWMSEPDFWVSLIHDEDRDKAISFCQECTGLGRDHQFDYRAKKSSGDYIWLRDTVRVILDHNGNPKTLRGVMIDIDAEKRAVAALRESEVERKRTEDFALVMPVQIGLNGRWQKVTPRLCEFLGYSEQELLNSSCSDTTHADDLVEDNRQIHRLLSGEIKSFDREKRYVRKDGEIVWAYVNCSVVFDRLNEPVRFLTYIRDITEQRQAENALRSSEERYRSLVQNAPVCIHEISIDGKIESMNPAGLAMIGVYAENEIKGVEYLTVVDEADRQATKRLLNESMKGESVALEFRAMVHGERRTFSSNVIPVFGADGKVTKLMGVTEDITNRIAMETRLRESEQRFRTIFEQAAVGVALVDSVTGRFVKVNRKYEQLIGYSTEEIRDLTYMEITAEGLDIVNANMEKLREGIVTEFSIEKCLTRKDGTLVFVNLTVSAIKSAVDDQVRQHIAVVENITNRKKIEQELRHSEASLAKAQEIARLGNWELDLVSGVLTGSAETYRILSTSEDEFDHRLESAIETFVHPEDQKLAFDAYSRALQTGKPDSIEFRHVDAKTKKIRFLRSDAEITYSADGMISGMFGTLQDITDRKEAESALRESENKFRVIAEHSPAIVAIIQDDKLQYASEMFSKITGYSIHEAQNLELLDLVDPQHRDLVKDRSQRRLAGEDVPSRYEFQLLTKNGDRRWIDFGGGLISYQGKPAILGIALDITDRRIAEEGLRQRDMELAHVSRLTTMGEMVAGIAHEINQPLSAISNYADACALELAKHKEEWADRTRQWAQQISQQAVRSGDIISRLRHYTRHKQPDDTCSDIKSVIRESLALMRNDFQNDISVTCDVEVPETTVQCNSIEFQQVIVNLLANAYEATQNRKERSVALRSMVVGDFLRVDIEDNGPGIHAADLNRVFDAFFTTKSNGIGMGLAISRSIVERYNGRLWVENTRPHGAAFHMELPLSRSDS